MQPEFRKASSLSDLMRNLRKLWVEELRYECLSRGDR